MISGASCDHDRANCGVDGHVTFVAGYRYSAYVMDPVTSFLPYFGARSIGLIRITNYKEDSSIYDAQNVR